MGANHSSQTQKSISSVVNNALNDVVTNISTELINSGAAIQTVELNARGAKIRGNIVIEQTSDVSIQAVSRIKNEQANKMANDIQNDIIAKLQAAAEQKNEGLNLLNLNTTVQNQEIATYVTNNLSNIIETNVKNVVTNDASVSQSILINLAYVDLVGDTVISQKAVIKNIANNVAEQIFENTLGNKSKTKVLQEMRAKTKQLNEGLSFGFLLLILMILGAGYLLYKGGFSFFTAETPDDPSSLLKYFPYILAITTVAGGAATYYMYYQSENTAMYICLACTLLSLVGTIGSYVYVKRYM